MDQSDLADLGQAGIVKPRELLVGEKMFFPPHQEPDALGRDIHDLNG